MVAVTSPEIFVYEFISIFLTLFMQCSFAIRRLRAFFGGEDTHCECVLERVGRGLLAVCFIVYLNFGKILNEYTLRVCIFVEDNLYGFLLDCMVAKC